MAYSERVHEVAAFAKSAAPQPSVAPVAMREFIGWQLSPNPFDLVKSSGGQQFASSIESVTARAAELCASQKWFAAEDHLHSAIWLAIADGNALWCVDAGIKLAELYLAMNELESTRALCLQLTPIATRIGMHDRALALCTAITLSAEMLGADEMARNATLRDTALCLQSVHESVRVSMQMHRMHRELFLNVCALLAGTAYENRLSAWRWGWAHVAQSPAQLPQLGVSVSVNGAQTA